MTNNTSKIIIDDDTHQSIMHCPHFDECNRAVRWRNDMGKISRDNELIAYSWFNRQLRNHTH